MGYELNIQKTQILKSNYGPLRELEDRFQVLQEILRHKACESNKGTIFRMCKGFLTKKQKTCGPQTRSTINGEKRETLR